MNIWILLLLQVYMAAILFVSGLAKVVNPQQFSATLRRQRILPLWSINFVARILPWLEVILAILLVLEILPLLISVLTLFLFASFLITEVILVKKKRTKECGCFGMVYPQSIDSASITVSVIFVLLSFLNLWGVVTAETVTIGSRVVIITLFCLLGLWLALSTWRNKRKARYGQLVRKNGNSAPVVTIAQSNS